MTEQILTGVNRFKVTQKPALLRDDSRYQAMRTEINRRYSPLSGRVDWEKVKTLAESIAMDAGADLLISAYYCVAVCKTDGVAGLATGLELMLAVLAHASKESSPSAEKTTEIINWMITRVTPDLKELLGTMDNVRDLYRCEYACQQLFELLQSYQQDSSSNLVPNLDTLGFLIFEKLDAVNQIHNVVPTLNNLKSKSKDSHRKLLFWRSLSFVSMSVLAITFVLLMKTLYREPQQVVDFLVAQTSATKVDSFAGQQEPSAVKRINTQIDELFASVPPANKEVLIYPQQIDFLIDLDKYYQRFSKARTRMANISQQIETLASNTGQIVHLKQMSTDLDQYASSLSPVLGRAYYIDEMLATAQLQRAGKELNLLDGQLKSLLIKRMLLKQEWAKQSLTEDSLERIESIERLERVSSLESKPLANKK
ncbi:type VI secretion system ImpA family N-terminal domain-containing protein [Shewanella surugensis]|uniref:Type VI secretion system ImpA family N-terminal domain-containing protein n=1 Tax=Shewanella surugensis TaxID=212020 RepID=A0ABT0LCV1_9GAMM|nr:type VI secretion system ImpA family N-terminal domain-containing protein [Shewanella surugensis]MCL1125536.1 type VI secretion system ImpA family N-terminal domain-containing protein [Shewanella surugensis]